MLTEWPDKLPDYIWMPDDGDFSTQRKPPEGIVIHSGERHPNVAEYAENEPDGKKISYHFAWSITWVCFVQMVLLNKRAWHAGREGNGWLGICLPGPWDSPRNELERQLLRQLVKDLQSAFGGHLKYWTRHSDITPGKKDPGPGFTSEWMEGVGLEWAERVRC